MNTANAVRGAAVIDKTLRVLELIADSRHAPRLKELTEMSGLPKPTLHRILSALSAREFVVSDPVEQRYSVGYKVIEMAQRRLHGLDLRSLARPYMQQLNETSGETVHLAVPADLEIVYIEKLDSPRPLRLCSVIGGHAPLYCTSLGKVLLAFLEPVKREAALSRLVLKRYTPFTITNRKHFEQHLSQIRAQGFTINNQEHELGSLCIGAPILDQTGHSLAAISVNVPVFRGSLEKIARWVPMVVAAASHIARHSGGRELPQVETVDVQTVKELLRIDPFSGR